MLLHIKWKIGGGVMHVNVIFEGGLSLWEPLENRRGRGSKIRKFCERYLWMAPYPDLSSSDSVGERFERVKLFCFITDGMKDEIESWKFEVGTWCVLGMLLLFLRCCRCCCSSLSLRWSSWDLQDVAASRPSWAGCNTSSVEYITEWKSTGLDLQVIRGQI